MTNTNLMAPQPGFSPDQQEFFLKMAIFEVVVKHFNTDAIAPMYQNILKFEVFFCSNMILHSLQTPKIPLDVVLDF